MPAALGMSLADDLTHLAMCWKLVRRDGVALGFTTHDRPLLIAGLRYESAPGMAPSAVVNSDGLAIDTMDVAGALSADAITADDLAAGRYDAADVALFMIDWRNPEAGRQMLARGSLGTVAAGTGPDTGFTATLRGPTAAFSASCIESYSPECRAELGDWRCRVAMQGRYHRLTVTSTTGLAVSFAGVDADLAASLVGGALRVLTGSLAGLERQVLAAEGGLVRLDEALALAEGDLVAAREGCDKRFATCVGRFANGANFRGEPHVPGGDVLTRIAGL